MGGHESVHEGGRGRAGFSPGLSLPRARLHRRRWTGAASRATAQTRCRTSSLPCLPLGCERTRTRSLPSFRRALVMSIWDKRLGVMTAPCATPPHPRPRPDRCPARRCLRALFSFTMQNARRGRAICLTASADIGGSPRRRPSRSLGKCCPPWPTCMTRLMVPPARDHVRDRCAV